MYFIVGCSTCGPKNLHCFWPYCRDMRGGWANHIHMCLNLTIAIVSTPTLWRNSTTTSFLSSASLQKLQNHMNMHAYIIRSKDWTTEKLSTHTYFLNHVFFYHFLHFLTGPVAVASPFCADRYLWHIFKAWRADCITGQPYQVSIHIKPVYGMPVDFQLISS